MQLAPNGIYSAACIWIDLLLFKQATHINKIYQLLFDLTSKVNGKHKLALYKK